jgi:bifunctional non-homologous end joining protein LigD
MRARAHRLPARPGWLHEVKHDGFRVLAWKQGERALIWSRGVGGFTNRFSLIAEAVRRMSVGGRRLG